MLNAHKILTKAPLAAAVISALGLSAAAPIANALGLADGDYTIYINTTPTNCCDSYGSTFYKAGKDGAWNSSFTFGGLAPYAASQFMPDETSGRRGVLNSDGKTRGSGVAGDGWTGRVGIHVSSNAITFTSFSKDIILNTAGGDFVQLYSDTLPSPNAPNAGAVVTGAGGSGTVSQATSASAITMIMTMTGRLGAIGAPNTLYNERWNFDDKCGTGWNSFTTGSVSTRNADCSVKTTINGAPLTSLADTNGDGVTDYSAVLVTGGSIGSDWGSFFGAQHFEVWNVKILSAVIKTDTATTNVNTAVTRTVPPSGSTGITPLAVTGVSCTNGTGTSTSSSITYTPTTSYTGSASCTYTVTDGNSEVKTGTVNLTVQAAGALLACPDSASTKQNTGVSINAGSNDTVNNTPATYTVLSSPSNGSTVVANATTGVFTYTPTSGFVGNDSFTYRITDTALLTSSATVTVTVTTWGLTSNGTYALGTLATSKGSADGTVTVADVQTDSTVVNQCVGGCYDFKVTGVTVGSVNIVLPPLSGVITAQNITDGLRYRKYINGAWTAFNTTIDVVASQAAAAGGGCPLPGATGWKTWTSAAADSSHVGDRCIRLSITDNGPNDSNTAIGTIADPSGAGSGTAVTTVTPTPDSINSFGSSSQGCSISPAARTSTAGGEWWLVAGFLVWLRALLWRRQRRSDQV